VIGKITTQEVGKPVTFNLGVTVSSASLALTHRGVTKTIALTVGGTTASFNTDATHFPTPGTYEYRVTGITAGGATLKSETLSFEVRD
jgi:hypothetical protein